MPSIYLFEAEGQSGKQNFITAIDSEGNKFCIQFGVAGLGLIINKVSPTGSDKISVSPYTVNQITVL